MNDAASAVSQLEYFYTNTFPGQIAANGDQPMESSRTRPYHYRAYNLAALVVNAEIGDYVGLSPSGWNRTATSGATIFDAINFAIEQDPLSHNETDSITELNPIVAAVASRFGDPSGKYAAFLAKTDPQYPAQPYYALSANVSNSGITQNSANSTNSTSETSGTSGMSGSSKPAAAASATGSSAAKSSAASDATTRPFVTAQLAITGLLVFTLVWFSGGGMIL